MSIVARSTLLLMFSWITPVALTALYVSLMRGESLGSAVLHWSCVAAIVASSLAFVAFLPVSRTSRVALAIAYVPAVVLVIGFFGVWLACSQFGSCM